MPSVLIIDDEPIYHKMVNLALSPVGYSVDTASNGLDGLKPPRALNQI